MRAGDRDRPEPPRRGRPPGAGEPVDAPIRRRAERATGDSLDDVRVHEDDAARRWVDGMGASGVTVGRDVALGSTAGAGGVLRDAILAHELAHAAQNRSLDPASELASVPDRMMEHDANRAAIGALTSTAGRVRPSDRLGLRRCDDPPPKVKAAASATDPSKLSGFEKMVKGGVPAADAAEKMQLPKELTDAMAEAWKNSFPGGTSKEQGGILVKKADGTLDWVKATKSTSGSTTLPWGKVPSGATPLADAHTHPYSAGEGGHKGVAFSGGDFSTMPTDPTRVTVVHAGDRYFVVAKTKEFEDAVAAKSGPDKSKYGDEIEKAWDAAFAASSGGIVAAALEATKAVCKKYNLVLYEGKLDGEVAKVDVTK